MHYGKRGDARPSHAQNAKQPASDVFATSSAI